MMNKKPPPAYGHGESPYCCFHPKEVVVGVCAHCLKDRLLLCLKQQQQQGLRSTRRTSSISLPKQVLAIGSSFLQRLDSRHHHHDGDGDGDGDDGTTSAASLDDSFISIKFEDNGKATWDSHTKAEQEAAPAVLQVVEHAGGKRGRWRKQVVGRLLQLARWRRSSAADGNKAAKARGGRSGWIRSLTRRKHYV